MPELPEIINNAFASIYDKAGAEFALAAMFVSIVVWLVDRIQMVAFGNNSLLGVGAGGLRTFQSLLIWGLGAGVASYLGAIAGILETDGMNARIVMGVGWPTVLPRLVKMAGQEGEPEQDGGGGELEEEEEDDE